MSRFDGKTEKPTAKRKRDARREGQIARSAEVGVATSLLGTLAVIRTFGPSGMQTLQDQTTRLFATASADAVAFDRIGDAMMKMGVALALPFLAVLTLVAIVSGVAQTGLVLAPKAAKPKLSRLSPKQGLQRLAPSAAGWELVRTTAKLGLLAALLKGPISAWIERLGRVRTVDGGLAEALEQTWTVLLRAAMLACLIAAADYGYQRWRTGREQKMSKEDVKREYKEHEGDPTIKAQRRRRAMELSRNRMLLDVASADVIITNPTHLAIALRYTPGEAAPRVVAKGADKIAKRIRAEAYRHGVPVLEDKPLARALFKRCKLGQFVPAALYEAAAVVLALAYRRRPRRAEPAGIAGSTRGVAA